MSNDPGPGKAITAKPVALQEIPAGGPFDKPLLQGNLELIRDVKVHVRALIGEADLSVAELFALKENSVLPLQSRTTDPIEVLLDDKVVAVGDLVVVGDNFGIRITEILHEPER